TFWVRWFDTLDNNKGYNRAVPGSTKSDSINPVPCKERTDLKRVVMLSENSIVDTGFVGQITSKYNIPDKKIRKVVQYWKYVMSGKKPTEKCKSYKGFIFVYEEDYDEGFD